MILLNVSDKSEFELVSQHLHLQIIKFRQETSKQRWLANSGR